jgi:hypothetical protein
MEKLGDAIEPQNERKRERESLEEEPVAFVFESPGVLRPPSPFSYLSILCTGPL